MEWSLWQCLWKGGISRELATVFADVSADVLSKLNVLTITFKTENEMTHLSQEVLQEREALVQKMISLARVIVKRISDLKPSFVDFIDPSSGQPMTSRSGSSILAETDPIYERLGLRVDNFACCKVVRHSRFGFRCFVTSVWTTAPLDALTTLLQQTFVAAQPAVATA